MVNTFLVHSDYALSCKALDKSRLGKQRVEAAQIIDAITALKAGDSNRGWVNHPATRSWVNNLDSLKLYFNAVVNEWIARGFTNNYELYTGIDPSVEKPYWVDCSAVHYSHMAQLIQKDELYYCHDNLADKIPPELLDYFDGMPAKYKNYGYIWPYKHTRDALLTRPLVELAEPYVERKHCQHAGCRNKASYGDHCGNHRDRSIVVGPCQGSYKNGNPCRNKSRYGFQFCGSHGGGESRSASSAQSIATTSTTASSATTQSGCQATCKTGVGCRNRAKKGSTFCHVHMV